MLQESILHVQLATNAFTVLMLVHRQNTNLQCLVPYVQMHDVVVEVLDDTVHISRHDH